MYQQESDIVYYQCDAEFFPVTAKPGDAGADLRAAEDCTLDPGQSAYVPLGVRMALPEGYGAFLMPRSGFSSKNKVIFLNSVGLIDAGYRGEVKAAVMNIGSEPVSIAKGDRIAQLVLVKLAGLVPCFTDLLPSSERGEGGFGHTGE